MNTTPKPETWDEKQARENREHAASRQATRAKLAEAFKALGFTPEARDLKDGDGEAWGPQVRMTARKEDQTLFASANGYQERDRVSFAGSYPEPQAGGSRNRDLPRVAITCALTKTPAQMAKDVTARLLPEYLTHLETARTRNAEADAYRAKRDANLAAILGRPGTEDETREGETRFRGLDIGECYGRARVYGDSVNLELSSVPVALAVQIIKTLRAAARRALKAAR